jgi:hypothetical protein
MSNDLNEIKEICILFSHEHICTNCKEFTDIDICECVTFGFCSIFLLNINHLTWDLLFLYYFTSNYQSEKSNEEKKVACYFTLVVKVRSFH